MSKSNGMLWIVLVILVAIGGLMYYNSTNTLSIFDGGGVSATYIDGNLVVSAERAFGSSPSIGNLVESCWLIGDNIDPVNVDCYGNNQVEIPNGEYEVYYFAGSRTCPDAPGRSWSSSEFSHNLCYAQRLRAEDGICGISNVIECFELEPNPNTGGYGTVGVMNGGDYYTTSFVVNDSDVDPDDGDDSTGGDSDEDETDDPYNPDLNWYQTIWAWIKAIFSWNI